jgi:hypothetical protein
MNPVRVAACHCRQLRVETTGEPFAVSICHCVDCQRRTGSAFGRKEHIFHFCPECGSQVFRTEPSEPELVVVSVGSFADPSFPAPRESGYDSRRHAWVQLPDSIQRHAPELWQAVRSLYEAGEYAQAADRAIAIWDGCREMAINDADFDRIRDEPAFAAHTAL